MVHTTRVSIKGSSIETIPSSTGSSVLDDAWAIGDDPWPASLEKAPLATPFCNAKAKLAPRNPPTAEDPVKTWENIWVNDGIIFS